MPNKTKNINKVQLTADLSKCILDVGFYHAVNNSMDKAHEDKLFKGFMMCYFYFTTKYKNNPNLKPFLFYLTMYSKELLEELQRKEDHYKIFGNVFDLVKTLTTILMLPDNDIVKLIKTGMISNQNRYLSCVSLKDINTISFEWSSPNFNTEEESPLTDPCYIYVDKLTQKSI